MKRKSSRKKDIWAGKDTPWEIADGSTLVAKGVYWIETHCHGGFLIEKSVAKKILTLEARKVGSPTFKGYYVFEEDSDCSVVFYEHPEYFKKMGSPVSKKGMLSWLSAGQEEYLEARGIRYESK